MLFKREKIIDESLFVKIGNNDNHAMTELYYQVEKDVYVFIYSYLKNHDDTLDLVQETFLKIKQSAHLYKAKGKPMAWILRIARNITINYLNRSKFIKDIDENKFENSHFEDKSDTINNALIVEITLNYLNEIERQIIIMHVVSGYSFKEIGYVLELPISTVLSKYHRSLKKLKKILLEEGVSLWKS